MEKSDVTSLKVLLAAYGIVPRRSSGQNFLVCGEIVEKTLKVLNAGSRQVTELGAGTGVVTQALLSAGFTVRALENDRRLGELLTATTPDHLKHKLELIIGDLRQESWEWPVNTAHQYGGQAGRPGAYQLVGNIPYNLSGLILRRITQSVVAPERAVLLVQQEVGQRLAAQPPHLQLIGLAAQLWGTVRLLESVPAECFWPRPKIASQLIALEPHINNRLPGDERERVLAVAAQFFRAKRKQMGGTARRNWNFSSTQAERRLRQAGIDPAQRPQETTVLQWVRLTDLIEL